MSCHNCAWWSDGGINNSKGVGWCYSEEEYTDPEYDCSFWQASLRSEPVNPAPLLTPEEMLAHRVGRMDREYEG
jgi:hypothetical protein